MDVEDAYVSSQRSINLQVPASSVVPMRFLAFLDEIARNLPHACYRTAALKTMSLTAGRGTVRRSDWQGILREVEPSASSPLTSSSQWSVVKSLSTLDSTLNSPTPRFLPRQPHPPPTAHLTKRPRSVLTRPHGNNSRVSTKYQLFFCFPFLS